MSYAIVTKKIWNEKNFRNLKKNIKVFKKLHKIKINKFKPKIIFFIHWSELIPEDIYTNYICIQFHASDLPKGRGGSPIQNQILKKILKTKITAFRVSAGKCLLIGGMAQIDMLEGKPFFITCFFSNELKVHPTDSIKAESVIQNHLGNLILPPSAIRIVSLSLLEHS